MKHKFFKITLFLIVLVLNQGCGYQPLLSEKNQKFNLNNSVISGDKRLGQTLVNKFNKVEGAQNNLLFNINALKKRDITNRNSSGSASEYSINVTFNLTVMSELNGEKILDKSFSQRSTYKASNVHIDTLNREKKIVDNMVSSIAEEITKNLNLIYN